MKLYESAYKDIIANHFDHTFDFNFLDLVADLIDRIDEIETCDAYEAVNEAIDEGLIYTADQWRVIEWYCTPDKANYLDAIESLTDDLVAIVEEIQAE